MFPFLHTRVSTQASISVSCCCESIFQTRKIKAVRYKLTIEGGKNCVETHFKWICPPLWILLQFRHESSRSFCRRWPSSRVVKSFVSSPGTTIFTGSKFWNMISNSGRAFSPHRKWPSLLVSTHTHLHPEIITAQVAEHQNPGSKDSHLSHFFSVVPATTTTTAATVTSLDRVICLFPLLIRDGLSAAMVAV